MAGKKIILHEDDLMDLHYDITKALEKHIPPRFAESKTGGIEAFYKLQNAVYKAIDEHIEETDGPIYPVK